MRPSRSKIARIIEKQLHKGVSPKTLAKQLAAYLLSEGRSRELNSLMRDVIALRAEGGQVEALATSARNLPESVKADVSKLVKAIRPNATKVQLNNDIDPELIGGVKLTVVNQQVDFSIRAKLNRLKQLTGQGGM